MVDLSLHDTVAVLIDADNVQKPEVIKQVLQLASYFGKVTICRAYGDWNEQNLKSHKKAIEKLKIEIVQVEHKGKNATDHRLMLDVGNLSRRSIEIDPPSKIVIVSGDGDFSQAVEYVKANGIKAIGIGYKEKASDNLIKLCKHFYFSEDLANELCELRKRYPIPPDDVRAFHTPLILAYFELDKTKQWDWIPYSLLGNKLRELHPDYKDRFGQYPLSTWLKQFTRDFQTQDQMVRRVDPNPEHTRRGLIIEAYIETKHNRRAHLAKIGIALRHLARNFEEQFGGKQLTEWVNEYPDDFKIDGDYIVHSIDW